MNVRNYLRGRKERIRLEAGLVKEFSVFDFNYIPQQPLMRGEVKPVADALLRYDHTGVPKNLALFGSRGCGKTLMLRYLAKELQNETELNILYVNVRNHNTSFKILAHLLRVQARGASFDELFLRFRQRYPNKTVLVLDEIDLISPKDRQMEILYRISRSKNNYMAILLSNSPQLLHALDASARSSLQPVIIHFKNYDAEQIYQILLSRARTGLKEFDTSKLRQIAGLTTRNTNSDVRVAIKSLFYAATEADLSTEEGFERASKDVVVDVVRDLNDKCLLILESARRTKGGYVKDIYRTYKALSEQVSEIPFSYQHFYNNLSYLQSVGLILLASTKVGRSYTNRIHLLFDNSVEAEAFKERFA